MVKFSSLLVIFGQLEGNKILFNYLPPHTGCTRSGNKSYFSAAILSSEIRNLEIIPNIYTTFYIVVLLFHFLFLIIQLGKASKKTLQTWARGVGGCVGGSGHAWGTGICSCNRCNGGCGIIQLGLSQSFAKITFNNNFNHHHHTNFLKGSRPSRRLRFDMQANLRRRK